MCQVLEKSPVCEGVRSFKLLGLIIQKLCGKQMAITIKGYVCGNSDRKFSKATPELSKKFVLEKLWEGHCDKNSGKVIT